MYLDLKNKGIRAELDDRNEKIGYKIRSARQDDKVPYMIIVGEKEAEEETISVRDRATDRTTVTTLPEFETRLQPQVMDRT